MVVSHWGPILKQYSAPILHVFGAPAIATFSNDQVDPTGIPSGMHIDELWDKHSEALSSLTATIHPMLVVAGSGMTRGVTSKSASQFCAAADPYLLLTAAEVTSFVNVATTPKVAAWYFPIGSNPPIGLIAWKLDGLTTNSLMSLVTAMVTRGAAPFVDIIRQHKNQMDQWLTAVQANPVDYQVHAIPWSSQMDYFLSMNPAVSILPPTISDILTYSPILDMLSIFNWRLLGDCMATSDSSSENLFFNRYLHAIA
jgi:hypothetical protein